MAKITWEERIKTEQLQDAFASFTRSFVPELNRFWNGVTQGFRNGMTIADNMQATIIPPTSFTHNKETIITLPNYMKTAIGFTPMSSVLANGNTALPIGPQPIVRVIDSQHVGITAQFQPPYGIVSLVRNAVQSITNATITPIQWDSDVLGLASSSGNAVTSGSFSYDVTTTTGTPATNSKIFCNADGLVEVFSLVQLSGLVTTGNERTTWIQKNNAGGTRWGKAQAPLSGGPAISSSCIIDVIAGTYLTLNCYQDSTTTLTTLTSASVGRPQQLQAKYVSPPLNYTANVTGVLWGG